MGITICILIISLFVVGFLAVACLMNNSYNRTCMHNPMQSTHQPQHQTAPVQSIMQPTCARPTVCTTTSDPLNTIIAMETGMLMGEIMADNIGARHNNTVINETVINNHDNDNNYAQSSDTSYSGGLGDWVDNSCFSSSDFF